MCLFATRISVCRLKNYWLKIMNHIFFSRSGNLRLTVPDLVEHSSAVSPWQKAVLGSDLNSATSSAL